MINGAGLAGVHAEVALAAEATFQAALGLGMGLLLRESLGDFAKIPATLFWRQCG